MPCGPLNSVLGIQAVELSTFDKPRLGLPTEFVVPSFCF